ncbi:MAG: hypothetical protein MZW92_66025 [Comamonadaceae bacterium]|nr:hypothetical protein [Comamonadaceae bacterium]
MNVLRDVVDQDDVVDPCPGDEAKVFRPSSPSNVFQLGEPRRCRPLVDKQVGDPPEGLLADRREDDDARK